MANTHTLKYTVTNLCERLRIHETHKQIDAAFETWQKVCGLKFEKVDSVDSNSPGTPESRATGNSKRQRSDSASAEIRISFLNKQINCPYKLNGQQGDTLVHAFYPGHSTIWGDIIFILKIGQIRKQFQGMGNATCSVFQLMNWDMHLASFILMTPIR